SVRREARLAALRPRPCRLRSRGRLPELPALPPLGGRRARPRRPRARRVELPDVPPPPRGAPRARVRAVGATRVFLPDALTVAGRATTLPQWRDLPPASSTKRRSTFLARSVSPSSSCHRTASIPSASRRGLESKAGSNGLR